MSDLPDRVPSELKSRGKGHIPSWRLQGRICTHQLLFSLRPLISVCSPSLYSQSQQCWFIFAFPTGLHILRIFYCVIVINLPDTTEGNFLNSILYINIYAKSHLQCNKGDTLPVWGTRAWTPLTATTLLNIAAATANNTLLKHHCYFTIFNYVFMCMSLHASPGALGGGKVVVNYPTW